MTAEDLTNTDAQETVTDIYGVTWTRHYNYWRDGRGGAVPREMIELTGPRRVTRAGYLAGFDHARAALTSDPKGSALTVAEQLAEEWGDQAEAFIERFYAGIDAAIRADRSRRP